MPSLILNNAMMNMGENFPKRKNIRLKDYDYSTTGAYFVTICMQDKQCLLSKIVESVGDGAHDDPRTVLTPIGRIIERNLLSSENIKGVKIEKYVIMPDHIHVIILLNSDEYVQTEKGTSKAPSPTNEMLPHIISTFKRFCNREIGHNIFQRSYIEHVIRDEADFETRWNYIGDNPSRWCNKKLKTKP